MISIFKFVKNRLKNRNWGDLILLGVLLAGYAIYQNKLAGEDRSNINKLENKIATIQTQIQSNNVNISVGNTVDNSTLRDNGKVIGASADNPIDSNWYKVGFDNKDGYYCSRVTNNKYWSLWSKVNYSLSNNNITTRIEIKPQKDLSTFVMSMGEYDGINAPKPIFQLNFFEGGANEVRIYGRDTSKPKGQTFLPKDPDFSKGIVTTTTMRSLDNLSGKLSVSFKIDYYSSDGSLVPYQLPEPFNIDTEYIKVEDGIKAQVGVGISKGGCFKVSSVSIK